MQYCRVSRSVCTCSGESIVATAVYKEIIRVTNRVGHRVTRTVAECSIWL